MGFLARVRGATLPARTSFRVAVGHFAVSGVGIWTDRQNQEGSREGSVGVGHVAIFNALKGMPSPSSLPSHPTTNASALMRAPVEIQINPHRISQASLTRMQALDFSLVNPFPH